VSSLEGRPNGVEGRDTWALGFRGLALGLLGVRMKVPVGEYLPDGEFDGDEIELDAREVSVYEGLHAANVHPGDVYGVILRLYEGPDGYRVHELLWPVVPGRSAVASLYPEEEEGYGTYTEQEAREEWGPYFRDYFESR
jgi:hypothetical protein